MRYSTEFQRWQLPSKAFLRLFSIGMQFIYLFLDKFEAADVDSCRVAEVFEMMVHVQRDRFQQMQLTLVSLF